MDLTYVSALEGGIVEDGPEEGMRLIAILVNSGANRHLLGYHPDAKEWQIVWEGSDEESSPDPFETADEWASEVYGMSSEEIFDMPRPEERDEVSP